MGIKLYIVYSLNFQSEFGRPITRSTIMTLKRIEIKMFGKYL